MNESLHVPRMLLATLLTLFVVTVAVTFNFGIPFSGYALMPAFVFHMALKPRWRELLKVFPVAAALLAAHELIGIHPQARLTLVATVCGILGVSSFLLTGLNLLRRDNNDGSEDLRILVPAAVMAAFLVSMLNLPLLALYLYPKTLDLYALIFDGSLGFQPSFAVASIVWHSSALKMFVSLTYDGIPVAMLLVYAGHIRRFQRPVWEIIALFFFTGVVGYFLYLAFPATGPGYAFPNYFPDHPPDWDMLSRVKLEWIPVSHFASRNAMPSLHMAWALLAWWCCRGLSRLSKGLGLLYVLITVVDTLGAGEHYLVDLVVGFPFALAMIALVTQSVPLRSRQRWVPATSGAALMTGWLLLVRYGTVAIIVSPFLPWLLVSITVAFTLLQVHRLPPLFREARSDSAATPRNATALTAIDSVG